jgi:hypothetical protein
MKSRAPSGVGLKRIGVSISRKPPLSIVRLIAETMVLRRPMLRCIFGRRRSSQRWRRRSVSSTFSSSSWKGSGVEVDTISSVSTWISTSPVGMFGLTASGARRTTSPSARSTNSFRIAWPDFAASGARSGLSTS